MIDEDVIQMFRSDRDRHLNNATRAIENMMLDLAEVVRGLKGESPRVAPTVGGSVLNHQYWQDAERALVRFWDAAGVVAILEGEADAEGEAVA